MPDTDELLKRLWANIDCYMAERWIEGSIRYSERHPNRPFGDTGPALTRLLALGVSRRDLSFLCREAAYSATFETIMALSESGLTMAEVYDLHEQLLMADPSGKDARPGNAPPPLPIMPPGGFID